MSLTTSSGYVFTDADLWLLKNALALAQQPQQQAPQPQPAPPVVQQGSMRGGQQPVRLRLPQPPVLPPPNGGPHTIKLSEVHGDTDKIYIYDMDYWYRYYLANLPGSHQLEFDMLTDNNGRTYWQNNDPGFKTQVNTLINYVGAGALTPIAMRFNVYTYTGPIAQVISNLVDAKLRGLV